MVLENIITGSGLQWQLSRFVIALILGLLITRTVLMPAINFFISRKSDSYKTQESIKNFAGVIGGLLTLTIALQVGSFGGLVTVIGTITAALTVAIGFGMRDEVGSLVSGIFIQLDNPFVKGDYIKSNDLEGVVKEINLRTTVIKSSGSEKLVMPNRVLTGNSLKNFTQGRKTKTSINVKTPVKSSKKAREILQKYAEENEDVLENPNPETIVTSVTEGNAELELHYWVKKPEDVSRVRSEILEQFNKKANEQELFKSEK